MSKPLELLPKASQTYGLLQIQISTWWTTLIETLEEINRTGRSAYAGAGSAAPAGDGNGDYGHAHEARHGRIDIKWVAEDWV